MSEKHQLSSVLKWNIIRMLGSIIVFQRWDGLAWPSEFFGVFQTWGWLLAVWKGSRKLPLSDAKAGEDVCLWLFNGMWLYSLMWICYISKESVVQICTPSMAIKQEEKERASEHGNQAGGIGKNSVCINDPNLFILQCGT